MVLVLPKSGAVFLHIQKTGGTWVRLALEASGVQTSQVGYPHTDYLHSIEVSPGSPRFTIIRNPYDWYLSFWAYRNDGGWGGDLGLGHLAQCDNFPGFVKRAIEHCPGILSELYRRYACPDVHILRTETLVEGLIAFLTAQKEPFNVPKLRETLRQTFMGRAPVTP